MKRSIFIKFIITFLLFSFTVAILSALQVPELQARINDYAGLLSETEKTKLESYLTYVENNSGAQIALLTIPSLQGDSLESYSIRVADKWKLGEKGKDNGVLLLIALEEKKIRIEVGYGLESVLTDAATGYIIREIMVPSFKKGNYEQGIAEGLAAIGGAVTREAPISSEVINESSKDESNLAAIIPFIIFILIFFAGGIGRSRRYRRKGFSPVAAFFMGSMMGSSMSRGSRGNSGFGGGGFSGGGFSGGGGGFGGGGASGGW
jgi:uncharacterized protein